MVRVIRERSRTEKDRKNQSEVNCMIKEWASDVVRDMHKSGYYGINIVERILRDPGVSSKGLRHKVLWWPRNHRIALVSKAAHQLEPMAQMCLVVKFGGMMRDDGKLFTKHDLAQYSSLEVRRFNKIVADAKIKLREIIKG